MGKTRKTIVCIYERHARDKKEHVATRTINIAPRTFLRQLVDVYGYKMPHIKRR